MRIFKILTIFLILCSGLANAQKISYDKEMGAKYSAQIDSTMGIYDDAEMTAYIAAVGKRLIDQLEEPLFDYTFKMVPTSVPNAFALPGGYLYVTTGLIPLLENEDELACIMAHEIIHANNRHSIKSMRKGILPGILQIPGHIVGIFSEGAGAMLNAPIKAVSGLSSLSYSRKQETEADVEGVQLAVKAGYNPKALEDILTRLAVSVEHVSGEEEKKSFVSDHPYTPDRVASIEETIANVKINTSDKIASNFLMKFDGVLAGDDPSIGVWVDQKFIQPTEEFTITMPAEWETAVKGNLIAAGEKNQNATIYTKYLSSEKTPDEEAKVFLDKLEPAYQKLVVASESIQVNGKPAYLVSFKQTRQGKEIYGFRIWMKMDKTMYEVYGIGLLKFRETLEQVVYSIHPLTDADKKEVTISNLNVVKAKEGESLEELSKRTENTMDAELSSIINNHPADVKFKKGDEVKVIKKSPFFK